MRISKNDLKTLKSTIKKHIYDAEIILFGSRIDDNRKGGDIDIFVETKYNITLKDELKILSELEKNGISRKVDLIIKTPFKKEQSIFKTILKEGIHL